MLSWGDTTSILGQRDLVRQGDGATQPDTLQTIKMFQTIDLVAVYCFCGVYYSVFSFLKLTVAFEL